MSSQIWGTGRRFGGLSTTSKVGLQGSEVWVNLWENICLNIFKEGCAFVFRRAVDILQVEEAVDDEKELLGF